MMKYADNYLKLANFGRELLYKNSLIDGLPFISECAKDIIGADRCSIFINELNKDELWTTISDGVEKIVIPKNRGVVGEVIKEQKSIIVNDVSHDKYFMSDIDKKTGYKTKNIIATPIFNSNMEIVGVLELLNKENGFDVEDLKFMKFFTHYISGFMELVLLNKK